MLDFVYTDTERIAQGMLDFETLDITLGDSGNEIEVVQDTQLMTLEAGCLVYAPGTEYGGMIRHAETAPSSNDTRKATFTGPSWSGMLLERIVAPPSGEDHYRMEGEANQAIGTLIEYVGLSDIFTASDVESGIELATDLERFCDAFAGLRKALSDSGARLNIAFDHDLRRVVLSAVQVEVEEANYSSDDSPVKLTKKAPVNHLVCAGTGELADRVVVRLYADKDGNVSETQSIFGLERIDAFYENTTAERDELVESGTEKLEEAQQATSVEVSVPDSATDVYALDQQITGYDTDLGIIATTTIGKKVLSIDSDREETYRYEPANDTTTQSLKTGSSGTTVATYTAGRGIDITGRVISAEVAQADLDDINTAIDGTVNNVAATYPIKSLKEGRQVTVSIDLVSANEANAWFS